MSINATITGAPVVKVQLGVPAKAIEVYRGDAKTISVASNVIAALTGDVVDGGGHLVTAGDIYEHVDTVTSRMVTANDESKSRVTGDILVWNQTVPEWQRGSISAGTGISFNKVGNDIEVVNAATPSRGGVYSYSDFATNRTLATEYYPWPTSLDTSSSTTMISHSVGQGVYNAVYGNTGALALYGLSSTDTATYSLTLKIVTNSTALISVLSPQGSQFGSAAAVVTSSASEQTVVLTPISATRAEAQAVNTWQLGFQVAAPGATGTYRISDISITVS